MISYREANNDDAISIAQLHAKSWQDHYRGIWSDTYLDSDVVNDRIKIWQNRFSIHNSKQLTVLAEYQNTLVGFACTFLDYEKEGEALLDNIHVYSEWQGKGIGKTLFELSHNWVFKKYNQTILFLWVLTANNTAIRFYEKLGGSRTEISKFCNPDGCWSEVYKYVWKRND